MPLRKKSFVLSFAAQNGQGQDTFVPLLSDGDLANAFTCARPTLRLRLDVRNPPESERHTWDTPGGGDTPGIHLGHTWLVGTHLEYT